MTKKQKRIGLFSIIAAEILYGLSFLFTKKATENVSALSLLSWRFVLAAFGMGLLSILGVFKLNFRGKPLKQILLLAFFHPICYFLCETNGIRLTSATESGIIIATIPVFTIVFSILFLQKTPSKRQTIGIIMTVVGVMCTVISQRSAPTFNPIGYLFLFACLIAYCFFAIVTIKEDHFSAIEKAFTMIICGAVTFSILALIEHFHHHDVGAFLRLPLTDRNFLIAILYLGIGSSIIAFTCDNQALTILGSTTASSFVGLSTIVTIFSGSVFLHEPFTVWQGIGTVLILIGVFAANRDS